MDHIIIILHFLCFAVGAGVITLSLLIYKRDNIDILKDIVSIEIFLFVYFFMDTINVYVRKILPQYKIDHIIKFINYVLVVVIIIFLYKIIKKVKEEKLHKKLNNQIKFIIALIVVTIILFLFSYIIESFQSVPYLCIAYLLQCILVISCIIRKKQKSQEESDDLKVLTNREKEIVDYIKVGLSNKEIGEKLFISPNTVKNHIYNIYKKVNVKNKVELINLVNKGD